MADTTIVISTDVTIKHSVTTHPKQTSYSAWAKAGLVFGTSVGAFALAKVTGALSWATGLFGSNSNAGAMVAQGKQDTVLAVGRDVSIVDTYGVRAGNNDGVAVAFEELKVPEVVSDGAKAAVTRGVGGRRSQSNPEVGEEFRVNTYTTSYQERPSVARLVDNKFVVAWGSNGQDGNADGVYAQIYNADGTKFGIEFPVPTITTGIQFSPKIAGLADGKFVITWMAHSHPVELDGYGVLGQMYNADGTKFGGEFVINTFTSNNQQVRSIAGLTDGKFVVTWESMGQDGSHYGVYAQIYNADGTKFGSEFPVNTYTSGEQGGPKITGLTDGKFIIVWHSGNNQDGSSAGVYGQMYNADGSKYKDEFLINTYITSEQDNPAVAALTDGKFVVTWMSNGQDGDNYGIYAKIYNADRSIYKDEFKVSTYTPSNQMFPSVTNLSDGKFVVTWMSNGQDGDGHGLYGQIYNSDGSAYGTEFRINTYTTSDQSYSSIAGLTDGKFITTWESNGQDGDSLGIYAKMLSVKPTLKANHLAVNEGQTITVTNTDLSAIDVYGNANMALAFTVSAVDKGEFKLNGTPTTTFTQQDIIDRKVSFTHDGSTNTPSCKVSVTDALGANSVATNSTITFTRANSHTFAIALTSTAYGNAETTYLVNTIDGGYAMAGGSDLDAKFVKLDSNFNPEWSLKFNNTVDFDVVGFTQTTDQGFVAIGSTTLGVGEHDGVVLKVDKDGNKVFSKTIGDLADNHLHTVAATSDGGFIVAGETVEEHDTWASKAAMPTARYMVEVVTLNDKIYAIGGAQGYNYYDTLEEYSLSTNTWTTKTSMSTARHTFAASVANGKIYAIGGSDDGTNCSNKVEEYNATTNAWTIKTPMSTKRCHLVTASINNKIYAIGGYSVYGSDTLNTIEVYDPNTDSWTTKSPMPTSRFGHSATILNDKIYIFGGKNFSQEYFKTIEVYDVNADSWTTKAPMLTDHRYHKSCVVNGRIYVIGGVNKDDVYLNTVEIYNPTIDEWTSHAPISTIRSYLGAVEANNKIYIMGGYDGVSYLNTVEEFTPSFEKGLITKFSNVNIEQWSKAYYVSQYADTTITAINPITNGYLAVGTTIVADGSTDMLLLKLDSAGAEVLAKTYGTTGAQEGSHIIPVTDGGYVLAGYTYETDKYYDGVIAKLDSAGTVLWSKKVGLSGQYDLITDIKETTDNGFIVTAKINGDNSVIFKLNSAGNMVWSRLWDGVGTTEKITAVTQDLNGDYVVLGATDKFESPKIETVLMKLDLNGNIVGNCIGFSSSSWNNIADITFTSATVTLTVNDIAPSILTAPTVEMAHIKYEVDELCNTTIPIVNTKHDYFTNLYTSTTYGDVEGKHLVKTADGGYALTGGDSLDTKFIKLDSSYNPAWSKRPSNSTVNLKLTGFEQTVDNDLVAVGTTSSIGAGSKDAIVVKMGADGSPVWSKVVGDANANTLSAVDVTSDGGVVVAGGTIEPHDTWASKAVMPTARASFGVAKWNGKIYAISGNGSSNYLNVVEEYTIATNTWLTKAVIPIPVYCSSVVVVNNKIYVIGGRATGDIISNVLQEYNPIANTWVTKASMHVARDSSVAASINGKIYNIGGYGGVGFGYLNVVEEYDINSDTWVLKNTMPIAIAGASISVVNNKFYIIGGYSGGGNYLNTVYIYDPNMDLWTQKTSMSIKRTYPGNALLNGKIHVISGFDNNELPIQTTEIYDPNTDLWTKDLSIAVGRESFGVVEVNNKIYMLGGYNGPSNILNTLEEFSPTFEKALLMKLSSIGAQAWAKSFVSGESTFAGVVQNTDDSYAALGSTIAGDGLHDMLLVKVTALGAHDWSKIYSAAGTQKGTGIIATSDGGYLVSGITYEASDTYYDGILAKLDSAGNVAWSKKIGATSKYDAITVVKQTTDLGYIVLAKIDNDDAVLFKLNSSGALQWSRAWLGTDSTEQLTGVYQEANGDYVVLGSTDKFAKPKVETVLMRLDENGDMAATASCVLVNNGWNNISDFALTVTSITPTVNDMSFASASADAFTLRNTTIESETLCYGSKAPILTGELSALAYTENQGPVVVDNTIALVDQDSPDMASATVAIKTNYAMGEDLLKFSNQNGITGSFDAGTGVLTLTGITSKANYQTALRSVQYENTSESPTIVQRAIGFMVNDGAHDSNEIARQITVTSMTDAPVLASSGGTLSYTENQGPAIIDSSITVADVDNANMANATISITSNYVSGEDLLKFNNQNGITGSFDAGTGVLTLTGIASKANYQTALRSVQYENLAENPSGLSRTISFVISDGTVNSNSLSTSVAVTPVNDAPILASSGGTLSYTENQGPAIIDSSITVTDVDNTNMANATISIASNYVSGEDLLKFSNQNGITGSFDAGTGVLTLTGITSKANYQTALRSVQYENLAENPSGLSRTISFVINDGTVNSNSLSTSVAVTPVNDAPILASSGGTLSYTENQGSAIIDNTITVADVDNGNIASASISIASNYVSGEDLLKFSNQNGITGSFDAGTGVLTLTGITSKANYQTALRSVQYENLAENPSGLSRTISFVISDGTVNSNSLSTSVAVTPVNDAPVLASSGGTLSYTENQGPAIIDSSITVTDVDNTNMANATISITSNYVSGEDLLKFSNQNGITGSFNAGTGVLTLTGIASKANYQTALRSVQYENLAENPSGLSRTISFVISDGTVNSNSLSTSVAVTPVNDAPVLASSGGTISYIESTGAVVIDNTITVADLDNANMASATIKITSNYVAGEDFLRFTDQNGITGSFNAGTGMLTLTGSATSAQYQTALRSVSYENTSEDPNVTQRTISFVVNDGTVNSNGITHQISVSKVNDAPVLTSTGSTISYTESAGAVVIDNTITVADVDNGNMVSATIAIANNYVIGEDFLQFTNQNGITGSFNTAAGVLTLTGNATKAAYQIALRSVRYEDTSSNPSGLSRTISFVVNDGVVDSNEVSHQVAIDTIINDAPVLAGSGGTLSYSENQGSAIIDSTITVTDVDNVNMASATIKITGNYVAGEDFLRFSDQNGITGNFNAGTGLLTLTGITSKANYQTALRSVQYENLAENPSGLPRTISFTVNDGTANSNVLATSVAVTPVNDAPILASSGSTISYSENQVPTIIDGTITVADLDNANMASATIKITSNYVAGEDFLRFTDQNGITGSFNTGTGVLMLSGGATITQYQTALRSVQYENLAENPSGLQRTISFTVNDGTANSNALATYVAVTPVNDAPILAGSGSTLNYNENQGPAIIDGTITVVDVDNANMASATIKITNNYVVGEDILKFTNQNGITGNFNAGTGVLTLSGSATTAQYQTALRSVQYENTSESPSWLQRTISFTVNDGTINSNSLSAAVSVTSLNDVPVLSSSGGILSYIENQGPVVIDNTITVADLDNANMVSASITIASNYTAGEDFLRFTDQNGITGNFNAGTGALTLTGSATNANYQAALRSVKYENTSKDPVVTQRTISFKVNDGMANSNTVSTNVAVTAINNAPVLSSNGSDMSYEKSKGALTIDNTMVITDADDVQMKGALVTISSHYVSGEDYLRFTNQNGIVGNFNVATGELSLQGNATIANYQTALRSIQYENVATVPSTIQRAISFVVQDVAAANSNALTRQINIGKVELPPKPTESNNGGVIGAVVGGAVGGVVALLGAGAFIRYKHKQKVEVELEELKELKKKAAMADHWTSGTPINSTTAEATKPKKDAAKATATIV